VSQPPALKKRFQDLMKEYSDLTPPQGVVDKDFGETDVEMGM